MSHVHQAFAIHPLLVAPSCRVHLAIVMDTLIYVMPKPADVSANITQPVKTVSSALEDFMETHLQVRVS